MTRAILLVVWLHAPLLALADGPADNIPTNVRRVPKLGIDVPADRKAKLEAGLKEFDGKITDVWNPNNIAESYPAGPWPEFTV